MKLRNKLILSCAALAAVATTAVSTTYAWYTSNDTVKANGINGTTADTGSDLLLIADGLTAGGEAVNVADLAWSTSITNVNEKQPSTNNGGGMMPLAVNSTGGLQPLALATGKTTTGEGNSDLCLYYVLYLKNAGATAKTVNMELTKLDNTTGTLPTKSVVKTATGAPHDALPLSSSTYSTNVLRCLALDLINTTTTSGTAAAGAQSVFHLATSDTMGDDMTNACDAVDYYNFVMDAANNDGVGVLNDTDDTSRNTKAFTGTITENGNVTYSFNVPAGQAGDSYVKLEFRVYIDGWNQYCFDACQGQTFEMGWKFQIAPANNNG